MNTVEWTDPTPAIVALVLESTEVDMGVEALEAAKTLLIDTIACAMGAAATRPAASMLAFHRAVAGGTGAAAILDGESGPTDPARAAFVNGHLANVLDADETLLNRSHFAAAIVPAALAVAQSAGASGAALIKAIVVGYEVAARVGIGMDHFMQDDEGNVRHVLAGNSAAVFGSTAAAGRLLGLTEDELTHAFGIAGKSAPVHFTWGDDGAFRGYFDAHTTPGLHKYGMYGVIARAGVEAAYLAQAGYTAAPEPFGPRGQFWKSFGADRFNYRVLLSAPSRGWWVLHSALKPWPTCRFGHVAGSLLAGLLTESGITVEEITGVEITIPSFPFLQMMGDMRDPDVPEKLVFSVPLGLAMIASGEKSGPGWWAPEVFDSPIIRELADRTVVSMDPELAEPMHAELKQHAGYYSIPTRVRLDARGVVFTAEGVRALGDPVLAEGDRDMSIDLRAKFTDFTSGVLGDDATDALFARLESVESLADVRTLITAADHG